MFSPFEDRNCCSIGPQNFVSPSSSRSDLSGENCYHEYSESNSNIDIYIRSKLNNYWIHTAAILVYLIVLLIRSPNMFITTRLWAEEGSIYADHLQHTNLFSGLCLIVKGNFQLFTNLIVMIALQFPVRLFPFITTYASLAIMMACIWCIARLLVVTSRPLLSSVVASTLLALQPAGYEVYLTATNVQWVFSLLALSLSAIDERSNSKAKSLLLSIIVLMCGLSGVPSCILAPIFLVGAMYRRTFIGWSMTVAIGIATIIQIIVILTHGSDIADRPINISLSAILPLLLHGTFTMILPISIVDKISEMVASPLILTSVVIVGTASIWSIYCFGKSVLGWRSKLIIGGAIFASLVNEIGALEPISIIMKGMSSSRYFFILDSCLIIIISASLSVKIQSQVLAIRLGVAMILANFATGLVLSNWKRAFIEGPSFSDQIEACELQRPCRVRIWPENGNFGIIFKFVESRL